jgi:hypothetical protein
MLWRISSCVSGFRIPCEASEAGSLFVREQACPKMNGISLLAMQTQDLLHCYAQQAIRDAGERREQ